MSTVTVTTELTPVMIPAYHR